ncbi:hypothetical protein BDV96DRAFT_598134 [Lophiotrema nucula]|uniref:Uncharacterized protein n=1 Tax=Lophiotrema nucula TaxID=690887 RepID=A0A6A5ZFS1_9PLEO|nr:hypothetical protein BDV96DRAFT_598134 [Lophiotrema nucula]
MGLLTTSIEIAASPETVRQKFLDFASIPQYHPNGFFKSISPQDPSKPLTPGDKLHNVLEDMTIDPTLLENSPTCFRWGGSGLMGQFKGEHIFRFEPSTQTPGGTTFTHEEKFAGSLAFIIGPGPVGRMIGFRESTRKGFESYNRDLKAWCEKP